MIFHIVVNDRSDRSVWPDFRRESLPRGWRFEDFKGTREACLQRIAGGDSAARLATTEPVRGVCGASVAAGVRPRVVSVPFPRPEARLRLFVFPHAGSGASSYHFLAKTCRDDPFELSIVQYPGREMRIREEPCFTMADMLRSLREDLGPTLPERPFAFLGHSMGALLAFELARELAAAGAPEPLHLFLSGRQAPQLPARNLPVDSLDDEAFLDAVGRRYNALPAELLANREILALILPSLRADFKLMAGYVHRAGAPLGCGLTLLNGVDDPWVDGKSVDAWQLQARLQIGRHWFPGGHFYMPQAAAAVGDVLRRTLGPDGRS